MITKWNQDIKKIKTNTNKKIDFVYTFVDSTDNKWKKSYKQTFPNKPIDPIRYKQFNEIYFSLKTVEEYAKNVCNNIYIVTSNQTLNHTQLSDWIINKIKYIYHEQIIPKFLLPTFNSITIESFLPLIPDLTPNLLYFNDDVFLGNYLTNNLLYNDDVLNILSFINNKKKCVPDKNKPWEHYYINADILFKKQTGLCSNIIPTHTTYSMNKKVCAVTWVLFEDELLNSMTSSRQSKNINFWYLCYLVGLYLGYYKYKIPTPKDSFLLYCEREGNTNMAKRLIDEIKTLFKNRPIVFCVTNLSDKCSPVWEYIINNYIKFNK